MNDDELDRNPNYAAVVFISAALAIGAQIIWNVPILLTATLSFPLIMWFFRPAFEPPVEEAKKPSDKIPPFREL
jgi:hypothetical protein